MKYKTEFIFWCNRFLPLWLVLLYDSWLVMKMLLSDSSFPIQVVSQQMIIIGYGLLIGWFLCGTLTISLQESRYRVVFLLLVILSFCNILSLIIPIHTIYEYLICKIFAVDFAMYDVWSHFRTLLGVVLFIILSQKLRALLKRYRETGSLKRTFSPPKRQKKSRPLSAANQKGILMFWGNRLLPIILILLFNPWFWPKLATPGLGSMERYYLLKVIFLTINGIFIGWFLSGFLKIKQKQRYTWAVLLLFALFSYGGIFIVFMGLFTINIDLTWIRINWDMTIYLSASSYFQTVFGAVLFITFYQKCQVLNQKHPTEAILEEVHLPYSSY